MGEARDTVPWIKGTERRISLNRRWHQPLAITCMSVLSNMHIWLYIWLYVHVYMRIYIHIYTHIHTSHLIQNIDIVPLFISPVIITVISNNSSRWSRVLKLNSCIGCRTRWFTFLLEEPGPLKSCPLGTCDFHAFYAVDWAACTSVTSIVAC